jgi:hypothetical protein
MPVLIGWRSTSFVASSTTPREGHDFDGLRRPAHEPYVHPDCPIANRTVYMNIYRVKEFVDTDAPHYAHYHEGQRITSWDRAFKIKAVSYEHDFKGRLTPSKVCGNVR